MFGPKVVRYAKVARIVAVSAALGFPSSSLLAAPPARATGGSKLTVYHWWTSPSESAAINALVELFRATYRGVEVSATVSPQHGRAMFNVVSGAARTGQLPDSFQMDTGYAAQTFFDAGLLDPVDDVWAKEQLEKVVPSVLGQLVKFEGRYYAVPIGVHRMNVVWCRKSLLDKHKINPSTLTTWEAFFKAAEKLRAAGVQSPIQVGERWTISTVLEGIMASSGIGVYEEWVNGRIKVATDARLLSALDTLKRYLSYANPDHADVTWETAVRRVIEGEAAFTIMGDWANGEFKLAKLAYGKDYEAIPVPGTKGLYGINVDAFPRSHGLADDTSALRWLKLAASREGQDTFNVLKGSISVRSDVDASRYDAYQKAAIADLKTAKVYPTLLQATPAVFAGQLDEVMAAFAIDQDKNKAATKLAELTTRFASKYTRVWSLK